MNGKDEIYLSGAISFMKYVDKHCHDKDEEICLDDDITILFENWKNEGKGGTV